MGCTDTNDDLKNDPQKVIPFSELNESLKGEEEPKINGEIFIKDKDTFDTLSNLLGILQVASYKSKDKIFDDEADYWLPVDQYIGGIEIRDTTPSLFKIFL